ncbi:MAG: hypothetical protein R3C05_02730 [Pirellulaceae bacterium]
MWRTTTVIRVLGSLPVMRNFIDNEKLPDLHRYLAVAAEKPIPGRPDKGLGVHLFLAQQPTLTLLVQRKQTPFLFQVLRAC